MKRVTILLALLALPLTASAQTPHPCDVAPTPGPAVSGQIKAQYCDNGKDVDGNPTTVTQVKIYVDGNATPTITQAPVLVTATPNAAGYRLYETAYFTLPKGAHTVTAALVNSAGTGGLSSPAFPFSIVDGLPSLPRNLGVVK